MSKNSILKKTKSFLIDSSENDNLPLTNRSNEAGKQDITAQSLTEASRSGVTSASIKNVRFLDLQSAETNSEEYYTLNLSTNSSFKEGSLKSPNSASSNKNYYKNKTSNMPFKEFNLFSNIELHLNSKSYNIATAKKYFYTPTPVLARYQQRHSSRIKSSDQVLYGKNTNNNNINIIPQATSIRITPLLNVTSAKKPLTKINNFPLNSNGKLKPNSATVVRHPLSTSLTNLVVTASSPTTVVPNEQLLSSSPEKKFKLNVLQQRPLRASKSAINLSSAFKRTPHVSSITRASDCLDDNEEFERQRIDDLVSDSNLALYKYLLNSDINQTEKESSIKNRSGSSVEKKNFVTTGHQIQMRPSLIRNQTKKINTEV